MEGLAFCIGEGSLVTFPFLHHRHPEGMVKGSILSSCNLTDHVTRKSHDSVYVVGKSTICTFEENRGREAAGGYHT